MKQLSLPTYAELNRILSKTTLKLHPSEAHGLICGVLSGDPNGQPSWEDLITGDQGPRKAYDVLQNLYDTSAKQLNEFLFELQLVLPADSLALPGRAEALTVWCQGFLTGLKLMHVPITDRERGEMTEAIDDLTEIAKMNYEKVMASDEDEAAYIELVEYVRMAVIYIYQDLRESEAPKKIAQSSGHLH